MTTTPTKNESLPELLEVRAKSHILRARAVLDDVVNGECSVAALGDVRDLLTSSLIALTREAPTEAVGIRGEVVSVSICGMATVCVDYTYYGPHILSVGDKFTLLNDKATATQPPHHDRGGVTEALRAAYNCISELPPTQARSEVLQMIESAIGEVDD